MDQSEPLSIDQIINYWPFGDSRPPRKSQLLAFDWLQDLPSNKKYILMEMAVGTGKSALALTLSGYLAPKFGDAFILTPQKILQKQYEESFNPGILRSMIGRANFKCSPKNTSCDIGGTIKPKCEMCPYRTAKEDALCSPNMVLNYKLAMLLFAKKNKQDMPPRKLMVFDECHVLESHLCEHNSMSISQSRCKQLGVNYYQAKTLARAMEWIESDYYPILAKRFLRLSDQVKDIIDEIEFEPRPVTKEEQSLMRQHKEYKEHLATVDGVMCLTMDELVERYVLTEEKQSFKFKELYGSRNFHDLMKPMADRFLFMSSTILNKDAYCRDLGLDPEEAAFLSVESEFPPENRPVIFIPTMKMNIEWNEDKNAENRKDLIVKFKEICDMHSDESGIVHVGNFKIAEWLVEELDGLVPHKIAHHNPSGDMKRDEVITEFLETSSEIPTLLISPSITEGLDLVEDRARFCVFVKIPFGNLGDHWIKRRKELSPQWYARQALVHIIQGAGRVVRSPTDTGVTYIMDSAFAYLFSQNQRWIPKWWQEAYHQI